ncbi:hypothetical protein HK096_006992, partial [Nowakowskiella sp. JEL0078]
MLEKMFRQENLEKSKLKKMVRFGIPNSLRGDMYARILKIDKLNGKFCKILSKLIFKLTEYEKNFDSALRRVHGQNIPESPLPPTFGGRFHKSLALSNEGFKIIEHILCILQNDFPNLEYCPMIIPLTILLSHHMKSESELLGALVSILKRSMHRDLLSPVKANSAPTTSTLDPHAPTASARQSIERQRKPKTLGEKWVFLPLHQKDVHLFTRAFGNLIYKYNAKLATHLAALQEEAAAPVWAEWLSDMFITVLPQPLLWRFLDAFVLEGYRAMFRFGLALVLAKKSKLLVELSYEGLVAMYPPASDSGVEWNANEILKIANGIVVNKPDLGNRAQNHPSLAAVSQSEGLADIQYRFQRGQPKLQDTSSIIKDDHWIAIWSWIPPKLRMCELELVFTTIEHGHHLLTFFDKCKFRKPLLLLIETLDGDVFGAYFSMPFPDESEFGNFVGNGETFLFTLSPFAKLYPWVGRDIHHIGNSVTPSSANFSSMVSTGNFDDCSEESSSEINIEFEDQNEIEDYTKEETRKVSSIGLEIKIDAQDNEIYLRDKASFFLRCTKKDIVVGGGGESLGLWLDERLSTGTTGSCATFANDPLTGNKNKKSFQCLRVE